MDMTRRSLAALLTFVLLATCGAPVEPQYRALIVNGQNNHKIWPQTTQFLKTYLEETGLFSVEVATTPPAGESMEAFQPPFSNYDLVVSNYNGEPWSSQAMSDFEEFVGNGGAFVSVHAANNAFPEWQAYNEIIGIGGWETATSRTARTFVCETGTSYTTTAPGSVEAMASSMSFPSRFATPSTRSPRDSRRRGMHAKDELYDRLRGPAKNLHVLATAFSTTETEGSGEHEPLLMTIQYGKGRIFHTALGHALISQRCIGFVTTFQRAAEWAVTGEVTQPVPEDFPSADEVRVRPETN